MHWSLTQGSLIRRGDWLLFWSGVIWMKLEFDAFRGRLLAKNKTDVQ